MLKINLSPQRSDEVLTLSLSGTILTINDNELDLSEIPNGSTYPNGHELNKFIVGSIICSDNDYEITILLPHGSNPTQEQAFPNPLIIINDGDIELPKNIVEDAHG